VRKADEEEEDFIWLGWWSGSGPQLLPAGF